MAEFDDILEQINNAKEGLRTLTASELPRLQESLRNIAIQLKASGEELGRGKKAALAEELQALSIQSRAYEEFVNLKGREERAFSTELENENRERARNAREIFAQLDPQGQERFGPRLREIETEAEQPDIRGRADAAFGALSAALNSEFFRNIGQLSATAAQTTAIMRGAGMAVEGTTAPGARGAGTRIGGAGGFFDDLNRGVIGASERMGLFMEVLERAPRAADASSESVGDMIGFLGFFGNTAEETTRIFIDQARNLNFTTQDIINTYDMAGMVSRRLGMHTNETARQLFDMSLSLRGVGADSTMAARILNGFAHDTEILGQKLSIVEIRRFSAAIAEAIGNFSPEKITGLMMFTRGGGMPTRQEIENVDELELMRSALTQIQLQVPGGGTEQLLALRPILSDLLGINISSMKGLVAIEKALQDSGMTLEDIKRKAIESGGAQESQEDRIRRGIDSVESMVTPLNKIENYTSAMLTHLTGVGTAIGTMAPLLGQIFLYMQGRQALGAVRTLAGAAGARAMLPTAARGAMASSAGATSLLGPLALVAAAGYVTYNALDHIVDSQNNME